MQSLRQRNPPRKRATLVNARSRDTRQALIRAALRLWSEGEFEEAYETTTPTDIARAAGVSRGTFYFHFANKQDLLLEMGTDMAQAMLDEVDAGMRRGTPLFELVEKVCVDLGLVPGWPSPGRPPAYTSSSAQE